jgi:hypothetical protein
MLDTLASLGLTLLETFLTTCKQATLFQQVLFPLQSISLESERKTNGDTVIGLQLLLLKLVLGLKWLQFPLQTLTLRQEMF